MLVFSLYTMVDGFFVANFVGETALSAVNLSMPFVNMLFAIAIIFAVGTQTIVGVLLGQDNLKKAKETFTFTFVFILIFSLIIAIFSEFRVKEIANFLGSNDILMPYVIDYLKIICIFIPFFIISYNFEVLVKVDGFPKTATLGVFISAVTNILLDYVFVALLRWGIQGAAWATGFSQVLSTAIFLIHFLFGKAQLRFVKFKVNFNLFKKIVPLGFGDFISEIGLSIIVLLYNNFIIKFIGDSGIATFSVISYVNQLVCMCFVGIMQGIQPLVSFYYGSEEPEKYKKLFKYSVISIGVSSIIAVLISFIFSRNIFLLFFEENDFELVNYSVHALRKFAPSFFFAGFNILIAGYCSSLLRPKYSIIINISRAAIFIWFGLFVTSNFLGPDNLWFSSIISEGLCLVVSIFLLARVYNNIYIKN